MEGSFQVFTATTFLQLLLPKGDGVAAILKDVTWESYGL